MDLNHPLPSPVNETFVTTDKGKGKEKMRTSDAESMITHANSPLSDDAEGVVGASGHHPEEPGQSNVVDAES